MFFSCCTGITKSDDQIVIEGINQNKNEKDKIPDANNTVHFSPEADKEAKKRRLTELVKKFSEEASTEGVRVQIVDEERNYHLITGTICLDKRLSNLTFESAEHEPKTFNMQFLSCLRASKVNKYFDDMPSKYQSRCIGVVQEGVPLLIYEPDDEKRNDIYNCLKILQLSFNPPAKDRRRKNSQQKNSSGGDSNKDSGSDKSSAKKSGRSSSKRSSKQNPATAATDAPANRQEATPEKVGTKA